MQSMSAWVCKFLADCSGTGFCLVFSVKVDSSFLVLVSADSGFPFLLSGLIVLMRYS